VRACSRRRRLRLGCRLRRLADRRRHSLLEGANVAGKGNERSRKRLPPLTAGRRKSCFFCKTKVDEIDYKNVGELRRYISEKGKIRSRRISGACRRHQRQVAVAVKRAREMALLPYVSEGREDRPGSGSREDRGDRG